MPEWSILMEVLREHDCSSIESVEQATLEVDGEVSVIRRTSGESHAFVKSKKKLTRHHKR